MVIHNGKQEGGGNCCLAYLYSDSILTLDLDFFEISGLQFSP